MRELSFPFALLFQRMTMLQEIKYNNVSNIETGLLGLGLQMSSCMVIDAFQANMPRVTRTMISSLSVL